MGLNVSVFRNPLGNFTNNGISSKVTELCIVNIKGPSDPSCYAPAALLVKGNLKGIVHIVPAAKNGDRWQPATGWAMMGGNYAATSDSRFTEAIESLNGGHPFYGAVAIHDRYEF